jgi:hypothetical protein
VRQVGLIAGSVLFLTCTAECAEITSDPKFVTDLIADLGFRPRELIERVRYLHSIPYEAPEQRRLSYCVAAYADRIATDVNLHEKIVSEVDQRACEWFQLCPREGVQRFAQSSAYAELLRVLADEMRGKKRAEDSKVYMEHESFVEFGRRLARLKGVEEAFSQASAVNGEISTAYILASCPYDWKSWAVIIAGLIAVCVLVGVFVFVYARRYKTVR